MKTCRTCKKEKPLSEFHKQKNHKDGVHNRCKSCRVVEQRRYWREKGKFNLTSSRRTRLSQGKKSIYGLNKRPYPDYCEICSVHMEKGLHYHHWDQKNPSKGMWVCPNCHKSIHLLEHRFDEQKYYIVLNKIEMDTVSVFPAENTGGGS